MICVLVALLSGNIYGAVFVAIYILAMQQIDGNIIQPRIVSNSVGIKAIYVLLAITIGGGFFGFWGFFLGVPFMAMVQMLVKDFISIGNAKRNRGSARGPHPKRNPARGERRIGEHVMRIRPFLRSIRLEREEVPDFSGTPSLFQPWAAWTPSSSTKRSPSSWGKRQRQIHPDGSGRGRVRILCRGRGRNFQLETQATIPGCGGICGPKRPSFPAGQVFSPGGELL